jgi:phytoene dehydrogenase-like protein
MPDAVVVGAGPNGLAAAVELARTGLSVLLVEANEAVGGAARTEEATLPGFMHDVGSAVYPLGIGSPFFSSLPLSEFGLEWVHPDVPLAHPLEDRPAVLLERSLSETALPLGPDAGAYGALLRPFVEQWPAFSRAVLGDPLQPAFAPLLLGRFARVGLPSAEAVARRFREAEARALFAGNAAHAGPSLGSAMTAAVGVTLMAAGHAVGWPMPRGGAGSLTGALARYFTSLGGVIETGRRVRSLRELPPASAVLLALTHRQVAAIAHAELPTGWRARAARWRMGPGAFKVDWALDGPIPWTDPAVARAGTVHLGGTFDEIADSERQPRRRLVHERPFVILAQPTLFDPSRAPAGRHTAWAYCHVPNAWDGDATGRIEAQVERFAPGFRDRILERAVWSPARLEAWNANLIGGDVNGGAFTFGQTLGPARWPLRGWKTPTAGLYVCSASTPPGGGVHGMAGYHAAHMALRHTFGLR